jgi:hypothetical protein
VGCDDDDIYSFLACGETDGERENERNVRVVCVCVWFEGLSHFRFVFFIHCLIY